MYLLNNRGLYLQVTHELKKKLSNFHSKNPQKKLYLGLSRRWTVPLSHRKTIFEFSSTLM